jgi:hypothetical protein
MAPINKLSFNNVSPLMARIFLLYFTQMNDQLESMELFIVLANNKINTILRNIKDTLPQQNLIDLNHIMSSLNNLKNLKILKTNIAHQENSKNVTFKLPHLSSFEELNLIGEIKDANSNVNKKQKSDLNVTVSSSTDCLYWLCPLYNDPRYLNFARLIDFTKQILINNKQNSHVSIHTLNIDVSSSCQPLNMGNRSFKDETLFDFFNLITIKADTSASLSIDSLNIRIKCKICHMKEKMQVNGFEKCQFIKYFCKNSMNFNDYCKIIGYNTSEVVNYTNISKILVYKRQITDHRLPMRLGFS